MENHEEKEIYQDMMREEDIRQELESLRPNQNPLLKIIATILAIAIFAFIPTLFPNIEDDYSIFILLSLAFISGHWMSLIESKKIHRRIDLLKNLYDSRPSE